MTPGFCLCIHLCLRLNEWLRSSQRPYPFLTPFSFKKVESASPSLWKFPTTPSWRIMTKPSNSCWRRSTRGQSSSLPVKKTYGEERRTFWLHPCCSGVLMACHVEVFNLSSSSPWRQARSTDLACVQHKHTSVNTNRGTPRRRNGNTDHNKAIEILFHLQWPMGNVVKKHRHTFSTFKN